MRYSQSSQLASLANSAMDPRDTAPDSWEQEEDAEARAAAGLQSALAALNVNAKPFVPNVNAAVFVPTFFQSSPTEIPISDGHGRLVRDVVECCNNGILTAALIAWG